MLERVGVPLQFSQLFKGVLDARQAFFFLIRFDHPEESGYAPEGIRAVRF
jgi:hypothetical protein